MKIHSDLIAFSADAVAKSFGERNVLDNINLDLRKGEVVALLGPSGCGKTTLLRIAAGLLRASEGRISIADTVVSDQFGFHLPPEERGIGMVFQDYAIWPHLSVLNNVAFPLQMRGFARNEREQKAFLALERVGLKDFVHRFPNTLSGGQQQRVALARAIVAEPPLVLFDEPLSNLDRELRESLALEIGALLRELNLSALYVTHDQAEAFTIADRVAVMLNGKIAQIDSPEVLFSQPASADIARFLNIGALISGHITADCDFVAETQLIRLPQSMYYEFSGPAQLLIPRTAVGLDPQGEMSARVLRCQFQGDRYLLHLRMLDDSVTITCPSSHPVGRNEFVSVTLDLQRLRVFPLNVNTKVTI
jgi:iron(III) transport system ATP-binding protein